ncbi:DUF1015 domain-containing protein [Anaeromicropila populeti]|uniref:Uncharacterized conserved protein, DUF1015 family n=1 Tax=Anaeromicropila populeti TaxID=37658 RepID=A0A1I6IRQ9_9FIRM|nr:DUF1015 domain-containing protein [Anaeromicropila populeti]SFR69329.1 Uncharacterized conserved protein, DUF1015 family [Anaeromicropila populeti]
MAVIKPFQCVRPNADLVGRVAALPYDVYNRQEAKAEVGKEPISFLNIDRAETQFDDTVDTYAPCVYEKARELFQNWLEKKIFIKDTEPAYYIYELIMQGRSQTGIVACASIDDYESKVIKKHENTRADKEVDRITHVDTLSAQTGPIFLAYRSNDIINQIVNQVKEETMLYSFISDDGIGHNVWKLANPEKVQNIQQAFSAIQEIYIADGHHRAASAVKVGLKRREQTKNYDGTEEFNFFLSVLFPHDQLMIMDYNRTVKDLNGLTKEAFINKVKENFDVTEYGTTPYRPEKKGEFGMYLENKWYKLVAGSGLSEMKDPVESLDVSLLQNYLLEPVLGIEDPRTDKRIDFIGGIRGLEELERRANQDMKISFAMYPTSINELFQVADEEKLMPPKSTWFEPKLRSGIFIHQI